MGNSINVGVDLHKNQFTVCAMGGGTELLRGRYATEAVGYEDFVRDLAGLRCGIDGEAVAIAVESTGNTRCFRNSVAEEAKKAELEVAFTIVNTLKFKVINESTKKTDTNDARTLAEFLGSGLMPRSHLCSQYSEMLRRMLKSRSLLVEDSVSIKNEAHAMLLSFGMCTRKAQFQSSRSRKTILEAVGGDIAPVLGTMFALLDSLEAQVRGMEAGLRELTEDDERVRLLMTVPGIGIIGACTVVAYVDDIDRFPDYKNFASFCGLVPYVQSSNGKTYVGGITKHGPQELRTALVQCVMAMLRMPDRTGGYRIVRQYHELKEAKNSGKAIIATARKLSRIVYMMLKTGRPFDEALMF